MTAADPPPEPGTPVFPLQEFLGFHIDRPAPGRSITTVDIGPVHHNPYGVAHGAVVFAMVDTGMGAAVSGLLPEGRLCATIEIQLRFLRPVLGGALTATSEVVHPGRRVLHLESVVTDGSGRKVALATGSFAVLDPV